MNKFLTFFVLIFAIVSCSKSSKNTLKVAATPVPHAVLLEFIKPQLAKEGIDLEIIVTNDFNFPNRALAEHEIDANFFQHLPFLEEQKKTLHYPLQSLAAIEIEPMGIYSKKVNSISDLKENAYIAIPNDPTNEARALLLLQSHHLIELDHSDNQATILNISKNPKHFQWIEVDAAMLPRILDDVDAAAINTNYALEAGLSPLKNALIIEEKDSPYANIIAIREGDENRENISVLKRAMTSEEMRKYILKTYKGAILPAF